MSLPSSQITPFDTLPDGRAVEIITLRGPQLTARILTMGATVQDLRLEGVEHPLVLGFTGIAPYLDPRGLYVGALVGRFANRIGDASFQLDGQDYHVDANERGNLLHGGSDGIHHQIWTVEELAGDRVTLGLTLADGHMGFPGELRIRAAISVADDALAFRLTAESDAPTPCNLAHHGYFALDEAGDIRGQTLQVDAAHWLPVDDRLIPTGQIAPVDGSAFDFRNPRLIGNQPYDHNLCLAPARHGLAPVAELRGRQGVTLTILTTEPGLQIYDGRHFDVTGLEGRHYGPYAGLALETQGWPDAPNQPGFPDCILRPGEVWQSETLYRFSR